MSGHDHIIEHCSASTTNARILPQRWEIMNHAGRVVAVTYTARDAKVVKAALDGKVACPECPHCIANMANWSMPG